LKTSDQADQANEDIHALLSQAQGCLVGLGRCIGTGSPPDVLQKVIGEADAYLVELQEVLGSLDVSGLIEIARSYECFEEEN